ncbi:MAG: hypothetical protein V1838_03070 [Patescibacteria group bacterium]
MWWLANRYFDRRRERREAEELADPYTGTPQVEGGILSAEEMARVASDRYREKRNGMTVEEEGKLEKMVSIVKVRAVSIIGEILVFYRGSKDPVRKVLDKWTAAWECTLSDGTKTYTLMGCGNDVLSGTRTELLPDTQVRDRIVGDPIVQEIDIPVWPADGSGEEADKTKPDEAVLVPHYRTVNVKTSTRYVCHQVDGKEQIVDVTIIPDAQLSIRGDEIYFSIDSIERLIGKIIGELVKAADAPAAEKEEESS